MGDSPDPSSRHNESPRPHPRIIALGVDRQRVIPLTETAGSAFPVYVRCSYCGFMIKTLTEYTPTFITHCFACLMYLSFCWLCWCLPYLIPSCNVVRHYCPACGSYLGTYAPI